MKPYVLLGAIAGDVVGSVHEFTSPKHMNFPLFTQNSTLTDDSILTIAVADAILHNKKYMETIRKYALAYPDRGYGSRFRKWMYSDDPEPYNSFGNGSAMRVSPVGWAFGDIDEVLQEAKASAECTHNHPEGIKGAQAIALAIFLARTGKSKEVIRMEMIARFHYDLTQNLDQIRPNYGFDETCQNTVPQAIIAFLEADDFEDAIRKAISLGGDADTLAAITGSIAEAYFGGVPEVIIKGLKERIPPALWKVIESFNQHINRNTA